MFDRLPRGLRLHPLTVRSRLREGAGEAAFATRVQPFDAVEILFTFLGDAFLQGRVKVVRNVVKLHHTNVVDSYSIVPAPAAQHAALAAQHRADLLLELRAQYKNAVVRAVATNPKNASRLRHRINKHLGTMAPEPDDLDALFADHPEALSQAAEIRAVHDRIAALP